MNVFRRELDGAPGVRAGWVAGGLMRCGAKVYGDFLDVQLMHNACTTDAPKRARGGVKPG